MNVETGGGAGFHRACAQQIIGGCDLGVVLVSGDHDKFHSRAFRNGRVVGERQGFGRAESRGGTMGGQQRGEAEYLRGLGPPQIAA